MKKIPSIIVFALAVLAGCSKVSFFDNSMPGYMSLSMKAEGDYVDVALKSTASNLDDFTVTISKSDRKYKSSWKYSEFPEAVSLAPGQYTVSASSPAPEFPVGWDQQTYGGSRDFTIVSGVSSPVDLVCGVSNVKVSIRPTERFLSELSDYEIIVKSDEGFLTWHAAEIEAKKSGYFPVSTLTVTVKGSRAIDNSETNLKYLIEGVKAADHHIINIDADVTGKAGFTLSVSDTTNDKETDIKVPGLVEIPVEGGDKEPETPEQPDTPDQPQSTAPVMEWPANPDFTTTELKSEGMDVNLDIKAPEKIKTFIVTVGSETLAPVISQLTMDGSANMDLMNDSNLTSGLAGIAPSLPTGDKLYEQTEVKFPLSDLLPLILTYSPAVGSEHSFTLTVTDFKGQKLEKTLVFRYEGN